MKNKDGPDFSCIVRAMISKKEYDVIVVGAGAAGLMAASVAGGRGRSVAVLDHAATPAEKIRISGGGRCNFTNLNCSPAQFISANPHFCKSALSRYTQHDFIALVDRHDIAWHEKTLGQLFCDDSAQNIIDMLLHECADAGVDVLLQTAITSIYKYDGGFSLKTSRGEMTARALVIASGGLSIPKIGATPFGYEAAKQFGLNIIPPRAGLVPLSFDVDILATTKDLSGIGIDPARVTCNGIAFDEAVLFTHRGISGPAILQISSYWTGGQTITVNLSPTRDVVEFLKAARRDQPKKHLQNILAEILPQRLVDRTVAQTMIAGPIADLSDQKLTSVAAQIQSWVIKPNGSEGYRTAEVTLGGVDTDALSSKTFESRTTPGLYFIGEVVDVTGWLGGYNFQWAWSSGWACGQAV